MMLRRYGLTALLDEVLRYLREHVDEGCATEVLHERSPSLGSPDGDVTDDSGRFDLGLVPAEPILIEFTIPGGRSGDGRGSSAGWAETAQPGR